MVKQDEATDQIPNEEGNSDDAGKNTTEESAPVVLMSNADDINANADEEQPEVVIATLRQQLKDTEDKALRALADSENIRKRADRERSEMAKYGGTALARDIIVVYDNVKRAMNMASDDVRSNASDFFDGLDLTIKEFISVFSRHNIQIISPAENDDFDPNFHQIVTEVPSDVVQHGKIVSVMQTGFTIGDRLLRPAYVALASAPEGEKE